MNRKHLKTKEQIQKISKWKSERDNGPMLMHYELVELKGLFEETKKKKGFVADIFPVRAVAVLEVFTRSWASTMVDHSLEFAERAIPLISRRFKVDYALVLSIAGKTITFGDIVGFTIRVSSVGHILEIFSALCGQKIGPLLKDAVSRWDVEVEGKPPLPIITDFEDTRRAIAGLYQLRHKICHESLKEELDFSYLGHMLDAAIAFTRALGEVLTVAVWGEVPLVQSEMNFQASERYEQAAKDLEEKVDLLRARYSDDLRRLKLLNATHRAWKRFIILQAHFVHDPLGGGTIGPLLRLSEMEDLTREREKSLKRFVDDELL